MIHKLLIVVDMQNDFITGSLGTQEAQAIVPKVINKVKNWDGYIFFTQDEHLYDDNNIEEKIYPKHCEINTNGCEIIKELQPYCDEYRNVFFKSSFGVDWGYEYISPKLRLFNEIEIIGLCTDICVISNALILRSAEPSIPITVDASCCAGTTKEAHKEALNIMKNCCINIINTYEEE